jgi:hypothetical protein
MRVPKEKISRILRNALRQNRHESPFRLILLPIVASHGIIIVYRCPKQKGNKRKYDNKTKKIRKKKKKESPSKVVFLQNYDNKNGKNV